MQSIVLAFTYTGLEVVLMFYSVDLVGATIGYMSARNKDTDIKSMPIKQMPNSCEWRNRG